MGAIAFRNLSGLWEPLGEPPEEHLTGVEEEEQTPPEGAKVQIRSIQERIDALLHTLSGDTAVSEEAVASNAAEDLTPPCEAAPPHVSPDTTSLPPQFERLDHSPTPPEGLQAWLHREPPIPLGPIGPGIALVIQPSATLQRRMTVPARIVSGGNLVPYRPRQSTPVPASAWAALQRWARASCTSSGRKSQAREPAELRPAKESTEKEPGDRAPSDAIARKPEACDLRPATTSPFTETPPAGFASPVIDHDERGEPAKESPSANRIVLHVHPVLANLLAGAGILLAMAAVTALLRELLYWF